jgi:hypothetical protein
MGKIKMAARAPLIFSLAPFVIGARVLLGGSMTQFKLSLRHSRFQWRKCQKWVLFAPMVRQ